MAEKLLEREVQKVNEELVPTRNVFEINVLLYVAADTTTEWLRKLEVKISEE